MYAALHDRKVDGMDLVTKAAWGAAGGLVAGGVLAAGVRAAQQPLQRAFEPGYFVPGIGNAHYIPAPSNKYVGELVKKTVHIPRNTFGALSKMAATAVHGPS